MKAKANPEGRYGSPKAHANHYSAGRAMNDFESIHQAELTGTLSMFDRIIFKGHLTRLFPKGALALFLSRQNVLLKDYGAYVEHVTATLKAHAQQVAATAGRPFIYLKSASGPSKEEQARALVAQDGLTEGLIAVFSTVEACSSFAARRDPQTQRVQFVRERRKCLHFYFYYLDREFGFMHVRLQSWFPFEIQIYINGREWLARQLDQRGIPYTRYDNKLTSLADLPAAQALCDKFAGRKWFRLLNSFARRVNPYLATLRQAGFGGYYWCTDQAEYATDVMFRDRASLLAVYPALVECSLTVLQAQDVFRFLGRKPHHAFQGDVTTSLKGRPQGTRVKHYLKRNALKLYDAANVLRVETVINQPREFRTLRVVDTPRGRQRRWMPMRKGVADFWRYAQIGQAANRRYLDALALAQPTGEAIAQLDHLCQSHTRDGQHISRFQPVAAADAALFAAVLAGEHALNGFRNHDLQARLFPKPPQSETERHRRSAQVSRQLAKLRGHGLIAKVPRCRLYRLTAKGTQLMAAALHYRHDFPPAWHAAAT
jgi:hypothetical protein